LLEQGYGVQDTVEAQFVMPLDFSDNAQIKRIRERSQDMLQALLPEFTLTKETGGLRMQVHVGDDLFSVVNGVERREFNRLVALNGNDGRNNLEEQLRKFHEDDRQISYRFDATEHPLRYANGGVLPVVRLREHDSKEDSRDYFCLFYRDIFPIGWNIANGASDSADEMLDPNRIIFREFGEEVFVADMEGRHLYTYEPGDETVPLGFQKAAVDAWSARLTKKYGRSIDLSKFDRLSIPLKWVDGPDRVEAYVGNRRLVSSGYFLNVTPADNAIELDRIALINLADKVTLFDGESRNGVLLNRVIGLFDVDRFEDKLEGNEFYPDLVYYDGEQHMSDKLEESIASYMADLDKVRSPEEKQEFEETSVRYDLCPVSRAIAKRYYEWVRSEKRALPKSPDTPSSGKYDVFISFHEPDMQVAQWLFQHLGSHGLRVFFSHDSLMKLGAADYCDAIDRALDSASSLIVVGTHPDHFDGGWVGYEWRSFINEIHSGRKPGGRVFTFASSVTAHQLPFALRSCQMISYSATSPQDSFENMVAYLRASGPDQ
jgi:hypothetical protein